MQSSARDGVATSTSYLNDLDLLPSRFRQHIIKMTIRRMSAIPPAIAEARMTARELEGLSELEDVDEVDTGDPDHAEMGKVDA